MKTNESKMKSLISSIWKMRSLLFAGLRRICFISLCFLCQLKICTIDEWHFRFVSFEIYWKRKHQKLTCICWPSSNSLGKSFPLASNCCENDVAECFAFITRRYKFLATKNNWQSLHFSHKHTTTFWFFFYFRAKLIHRFIQKILRERKIEIKIVICEN